MDPLLAVIIAMAVVFFAIALYMEWLGLVSIVASRNGLRHAECGHPKLTPANEQALCWHCRHQRLDHALRVLHH